MSGYWSGFDINTLEMKHQDNSLEHCNFGQPYLLVSIFHMNKKLLLPENNNFNICIGIFYK